MDFTRIAGTSSSTSWYSPAATGVTTPDSDLELKRQAHALGDFIVIENAWLGEMFCQGRRVMLRVKSVDKDKTICLFGLHHFSDSCVLAQRFRIKPIPGAANDTWFDPICDERPTLRAIFDVDDVTACSFEVLAPSEQQIRWPKATWPSTMVRAVASSPFKPLKEVAARSAFWSLKIGYLTRFAKFVHIPLPDKANLIEVLIVLVSSVLKISENDAMDIIALRMALVGSNSRFQVDVLDMDDAEAVLDPHDERFARTRRERRTRTYLKAKSSGTTSARKRKSSSSHTPKGRNQFRNRRCPRWTYRR